MGLGNRRYLGRKIMKTVKFRQTIVIVMIAVVMGLCVAIAGATSVKVGAAESPTAITAEQFKLKGTSVRYVDETYSAGVKFHVLLDKTVYEGLSDSAVTGVKLCPKSLLGSESLKNSENQQIKDKSVNKSGWFESKTDAGMMELVVYVYDIAKKDYGTDLSVVGYVTDNGTTYYTAEEQTALAKVAKTAASSETDEAKKAQLKGYYTFAVKFYDVNESLKDMKEVEYGVNLTAPEGDYGWYNKDKTAKWNFETDVVTGDMALYAKQEKVTLPAYTESAVYTGEALSCGLTTCEDYTVTYTQNGETVTPVKAGEYTVTVALKEGMKWEDGTNANKTFTFTVAKKNVTAPTADETVYKYTGEEQTYTIAESADYTVTGNKQTAVGEHTVTVALTDAENTQWADGTTENKTFTFTISKKDVTAPAADETVYKCTGAEQTYAIPESADYTVTGNKQTGAGEYTVTVTLNDTANAQWADGTTENKTFAFVISHNYQWTAKDGVATYECAGHDDDANKKTLNLSVAERQDVILNLDNDGKSTVAATLDISSIGEYESVEKVVFSGATVAENSLTIPAQTAFTAFGEKNMTVTVKTADGASHEITVPVTVITESITTFDRLKALVQITSKDCGKFNEGKYFILGGDITIANSVEYNTNNAKELGWYSISGGNGFAGTLDGRNHSIIGGKMSPGGLFGSLQNAVVKNIKLTNVQAVNNSPISVLTGCMRETTLENVEITVKGNVDVRGWNDSIENAGLIASNHVASVTLKDVTVNAAGCSFETLFGKGYNNKGSNLACTNVVVTVKGLEYITVDSNTANATPNTEVGTVPGITVRKQVSVSPTEKLSLIKDDFTLTLGAEFSDVTAIKSASYNGEAISTEGWTVSNGVLSGTKEVFGITETGSITFVIVVDSKGFEVTLTITAGVESGLEKVALTENADLVLAADGVDNTEITVDLGETYAGYTVTAAIVGGTKLTVENGKIIVNDVLKGVKAGVQTLIVEANNGESYYEITMPATVVTESVTTFNRLVELVQITNGSCGKFNEGKYFILGGDITLDSTQAYNKRGGNGFASAGAGNGFAGTLDGRKHSIIGGKMATGGLFGSLQNATVKDINFTNVQAATQSNYGGAISVITGSMYYSTLENITVTVSGSAEITGVGGGIISSNRVLDVTLKNVTVNATECSFTSVFGAGYNNQKAKYTCDGVTINVKSVACLASHSDGSNQLAIGAVLGITVNQQKQA